MDPAQMDQLKCAVANILQPIACKLLEEPLEQNAKTLEKAVTVIDGRTAQELQIYILYPVQVGLQNKKLSESLLISFCDVIKALFSKTRILRIEIFTKMYSSLLALLSESRQKASAKFSEESEMTIIRTLMLIMEKSNENVLSQFYHLDYYPFLAELITVLLHMTKDKSRELQKLALDCLLLIMQADTDYGSQNAVILGDIFAYFLPGIVTGMVMIVNGNPNQGQAVFVKTISVVQHLLTLELSDSLLQESEQRIEKLKLEAKDPKNSMVPGLQRFYTERNQTWVISTCKPIGLVITPFCGLVTHSHWRVRLAVAQLTEQLILKCSRTLSEYLPKLLESLVTLIHDPYPSVASKAVSALEQFKADHSGQTGEKTLTEILEDSIFTFSTSLPRLIKFSDEEKKPQLINLLRGYISLLGDNISNFISSSPHIRRVCQALVQILDIETSDVRVVEERGLLLHTEPSVFTETSLEKIWKPRKYFKHFRDDAIYDGLMDVCSLLGYYGDIYTLVDHMMELYHESVVYQLAAVLIINQMIVGASHPDQSTSKIRDSEVLIDVVRILIDEYVSPGNLKLVDDIWSCNRQPSQHPSSSSLVIVEHEGPGSSKEMTIANKNRSILLTCLFLEGLGKFATALKQDFKIHLIKALYPLVENLGHENFYLSSMAYSSLVEVALACGYGTIDQLIRENADYLVSCVSQRLCHPDLHFRAPRAICVMLRYCSKDLFYLISHSITQLFESLDDNYTHHLMLFMPVLLELVKAIGRWYPVTRLVQQEVPEKKIQPLDKDKLCVTIIEYFSSKVILHTEFCNDFNSDLNGSERKLEDIEADINELISERKDMKDGQEDEEMEEEFEVGKEQVPKEPPRHIQVVQEVMRRIGNLMLCKEQNLRMMALDVVCQGCQDLADQERELLPQLHQMWPTLAAMFRQEEKFIVVKAMKTLVTLTELSGDFLRLRIMKEIIPGLTSYMEKQAKISCESSSAYLHTGNCKLQTCVLSSLGKLATNLKLESNDLDAVVNICLAYLCELQPSPLQQAALESFFLFYALDSDALWVSLNMIYSPEELQPPGPEFIPLKFPDFSKKKNSFSKNISFLLNKFYR